MAQRIKGQEVNVSFAGPTGTVDGLADIRSFEWEFQLDTTAEGYLGESTERRDDIFRGATGSMEIHMEGGEFFDFVKTVLDRAARRAPAAGQFNITASFDFPNGDRRRVQFVDVFFGNIPGSAPGRDEYVTATISWECSEVKLY